MDSELSHAIWHKSTYSNGSGGNCVETAALSEGRRAVRDSKDPHGSVLIFTASEWEAFIAGVKAGEFE
jgi:Domain of unknown function (DUF397)